jgi:hypothetical protein
MSCVFGLSFYLENSFFFLSVCVWNDVFVREMKMR